MLIKLEFSDPKKRPNLDMRPQLSGWEGQLVSQTWVNSLWQKSKERQRICSTLQIHDSYTKPLQCHQYSISPPLQSQYIDLQSLTIATEENKW
jgi:hypothetical protein